MVDLRQAIANADRFAQEILGDKVEDLAVEEIELDTSANQWNVTLGFSRRRRNGASPGENPILFELQQPRREFRTFWVNAESGEVTAMKKAS